MTKPTLEVTGELGGLLEAQGVRHFLDGASRRQQPECLLHAQLG